MTSITTIGHRGAKSLEPENTLLSFKRAIALGVDMVELDVHLTKDKHIVVIHDPTLERTTNGSGAVNQKSLEELKKLDAGKGEKIPTLNEVIALCAGKAKIIIELKGEGTELAVAHLITRNTLHDDVRVISFDHTKVLRVHELDARIKTGILLVGHPVSPEKDAKLAESNLILAQYRWVTKRFLKKCHDNSIDVYVWNVDSPQDMEKMIALGVDGICSNDPRLFGEPQ